MTRITCAELLKLSVEGQNVHNIRQEDGIIYFDIYRDGFDTETEGRIRQNDLEYIESFFASALQSRPFAKHLLQIFWLREVKFEMGSLRDDDKYVFIKGAFDLYGIDIDVETMEDEFYALLPRT
jgi:hypothetical protein